MLAVYVNFTASRYGFLGCKLKCWGYIIKREILVFSYCLVNSFLSGVLCFCSWKENCFMLDYFETKLQKPGGPVHQGNLVVYYLFSAALTWKRVWRPWALDGGSGAIKPVLWPYVQWYHARNVIFFFHLHVQSVGRDTKLHSGVSLNYECGHWVWPCSGSSGHWVWSEHYLAKAIIEWIASRRRNVCLNAARF